MVKIRLVAVGRIKEKYYAEAVAEYAKRLRRFCDFEIVEVKEENYDKQTFGEISKILFAEGERIEKAVKGYAVALAIEGEKISSENFAARLKKLIDEGKGEITFIIGGSYGIENAVKDKAKKISFSDMTFPHTLMRVIFTEQLYRAFTIINNAEYHK